MRLRSSSGQQYFFLLRQLRPASRSQRSFASKVRNYSWIGSVQGAVATWSVISMRYFLTIFDSHGFTRSLPLPVLTRSKCDSYFSGKANHGETENTKVAQRRCICPHSHSLKYRCASSRPQKQILGTL